MFAALKENFSRIRVGVWELPLWAAVPVFVAVSFGMIISWPYLSFDAYNTTVYPWIGWLIAFYLVTDRHVWPLFMVLGLLTHWAVYVIYFQLAPLGYLFISIPTNIQAPLTAFAVLFLYDRLSERGVGRQIGMLAICCGAAPIFGATFGMLMLVFASNFGSSDPENIIAIWQGWWAGDLISILIYLPFALYVFEARGRRAGPITAGRPLEMASLIVLTVLATLFLFGPLGEDTTTIFGQPVAIFPFLIWSGLRFGHRLNSVLIIFVSHAALILALNGVGPFAIFDDLFARTFAFQSFFIVLTLSVLVLTLVVADRQRKESALALANSELAMQSQELAIAVTQANAATDAKSRFLANMSHEFRTPLNAILGYNELLRYEVSEAGLKESGTHLDEVEAAGSHLLQLINNILEFSRLETGQVTLGAVPIDIQRTVTDVAGEAEPQMRAAGIQFRVDLPDDIGDFNGDLYRLRQILLILLDNATKFAAGQTVRLAARHAIYQDASAIEFVVEDTGVGMDSVHQEQIFNIFTQADDSSTRAHQGAGLGLAICRELATRMGGTISVDSALGEGAIFRLILPRDGPVTAPIG